MSRRLAALALLLPFAVLWSRADAAVIRVPSEEGTIQRGVDVSAPGDTVLVAPGTYPENVSIPHQLTLLSEMGPEVTTIDAGGTGTVVFVDDTAPGTTIEGFRITRGHCLDVYVAGGIHVEPVEIGERGPVIRDNIIEHNHSIGGCGGVYAFRDATIEDNVIQFNNHPWGGDHTVAALEVVGIVRRNIIRNNGDATDRSIVMIGGGNSSPFTVVGNVIVDNGGVAHSTVYISGSGVVNNNTIYDLSGGLNFYTVYIRCLGPGQYEFTHNIVVHGHWDGLRCRLLNGASHIVECNDVWGLVS
jgi:hypothetical protein